MQSSPERTAAAARRTAWWLALAALAACGPWPGWRPSPLQLGAVVAGLAVLARPRGRERLAWLAVVLGVFGAVWRPVPVRSAADWEAALAAHCDGMLRAAQRVAGDPVTRRVFTSTGEVVEPELLFRTLRRGAGGLGGRTVYLADDRGRLVAWAGLRRRYPPDLRPLGERRWVVAWWAGSAALVLREPILFEGRLTGSVTVVDRSPRAAPEVWGMRAGPRTEIVVSGARGGRGVEVTCRRYPGVTVRVTTRPAGVPAGRDVRWWPWLAMAVLGVAWSPAMGAAAAVVGGLALAAAPAAPWPVAAGVALLLAGGAAGRLAAGLPGRAGAWLSVLVLGLIPAAAVAWPGSPMAGWLPRRAFHPGWGAVWMIAGAWVLAGRERGRGRRRIGLERRLALGLMVAAVGLAAELAHVPAVIFHAESPRRAPILPRGAVDVGRVLPTAAGSCHLDDLAGVLAANLRLRSWRTPSMLVVRDPKGDRVSQWGDLAPAGDALRRIRSWDLVDQGRGIGRAALYVAGGPWGLLRDWRTWTSLDRAEGGEVWFSVMTRSGQVVATLHREIHGLSPARAGTLYHAGGGWTMVGVGEGRRLAHVRRSGDWLVAAVGRYPAPGVWLVRSLLALLWAMLGTALAVPPMVRWERFTTFGGRLRLLVTGAVILPLVLLTLFLHQRLRQDGVHLERVIAGDALRSARWTALHLAGGFQVNEDLARWMARQVGGEVVIFDGARLRAASRPDLLDAGRLPALPSPAAYSRFMLGRDDPLVLREGPWLVGAGGAEILGRRFLLEVFPRDPLTFGGLPDVVDWLLTGAATAAFLALLVASRVERRLGTSLRSLVELSERVERGEPVVEVARPPERDIAQVLDAVRLMSREVQRRERELRSQEELLRITLSTLNPAVVVFDADGSVRFANPSARELFGERPEAALAVAREVEGGGETAGRAAVGTVNPYPGRDVTWRVGAAEVPLPTGRSGKVVVVDDVSEVVQADRFRQLNQLARIVAHEVKNPLTPIRLWVQELEAALERGGPGLDGVLREACSEIATQVARLEATAASFSNLVALERWEAEEVDLADVVASAMSGMKVLERRGIRVAVDVPEGEYCRVVGDRNWLRRAVSNLIQNSLDVLRGRAGEIAIRIRCAPGRVVLEVEDTGGGVPENELGELFNPRFSTTSSGTGLGLALVRHVAARCHGTVTAVNGERGLLVRLELPASAGTSARMQP